MSTTMARKKTTETEPKEPEAANLPFSLRLRDDVAEALAAFRERVAKKTGWDAPSKPEIIDRALRAFLQANGFPLSDRPGGRD